MANPDDRPQEAQDAGAARASKSERKRAADALQELGVELAGLTETEIRELGLPEPLSVALATLKRLRSHGAQVRQRQYIGKLMRRIDPGPMQAKIAERKQRHDREVRHFQVIERWRERLLADDGHAEAAIGAFLADHPRAEREVLARLVAKAMRERAEQRAPAAARELFGYLRRWLE